jgi:hypothetical protein
VRKNEPVEGILRPEDAMDEHGVTRRRFLQYSAAAASTGLIRGEGGMAQTTPATNHPAAAGGRDAPLIAALDLDRPELREVRAAADRGDLAGARAAFAAHLRSRGTPKWFFDPANPPKDLSEGDRATADRALEQTLESVDIRHRFEGPIDWSFNPTTQPESPHARGHEWTWQLNRHPAWVALARAYTATGDPKYGREVSRQVKGWIDTSPPPPKPDNSGRSRWRTIECGIRMAGSWQNVYHHLVRAPEVFPDDVLLAMVDCMRRHAEFLDANPTTGNWLAMEANGAYHVGVMFPEFKDADRWRDNAIARLRREIDAQVYPDGTQIELSPGYHGVSLRNFVGALRIARLNDQPLPGGYQQGLERMYDVFLWAMSPDRDVPYLNDSWRVDVVGMLRQGLELFPHRKDWAYVVSDGKEGAPPDHASHLFPYAGWCVMRSGWDRDATFLLMDAGPFGYGHQHEDKLSFVLHAYGSRLVFDAGSYAYDASDMRKYVLSARGHNVVHVDGLEQNRRGLPRDRYVTKSPVPLTWQTSPGYDYAAATFGEQPEEGWGPDRTRQVVHARRVLFVKPDYWIVVDTLTPADAVEHAYESTFHLDAPEVTVDEATRSVVTRNPDGANLGIFPVVSDGLTVRVVSGQEEPVLQGWLPREHGRTGASPRPTPHFARRARGPVHFAYVFAPARPGEEVAVKSIEPAAVPGAMLAFDVRDAAGAHRFVLGADGNVTFRRGDGSASFDSLGSP